MDDSAYIKKVKRADRLAAIGIRAGGLLVVLAILGVFFEIASVGVPLFLQPSTTKVATQSLLQPSAFIGADTYGEAMYSVSVTGQVSLFQENGEQELFSLATNLTDDLTIQAVTSISADLFAIVWADGSVTVHQFKSLPQYDQQGNRTIAYQFQTVYESSFFAGVDATAHTAAWDPKTRTFLEVIISQQEGARFYRSQQSTNFLGQTQLQEQNGLLPDSMDYQQILIASDAATVFMASESQVSKYTFQAGQFVAVDQIQVKNSVIQSLGLMIGNRSLVVGLADTGVRTYAAVRKNEFSLPQLAVIHEHFHDLNVAIKQIQTSQRNRMLTVLDADGTVRFEYVTNERELLTINADTPIQQFALNSRNNYLVTFSQDQSLDLWHLDIPHPEASWSALFTKLWYEGYDHESFVWQSSGATSDFEAKLSFMPLIFGTLKATVFALLFSVPFALFGAIYTSQFLSVRLRKWIKPVIEMMAAFPSVVIGFLAALWFAPILETHFVSLGLFMLMILILLLVWLFVWQQFAQNPMFVRKLKGYEFLGIFPILCIAWYLSSHIGPSLEVSLFAGDFRQWLYTTTGIPYDQRNSVVIAFALGFAVIPVIFTLADDALSNIPRSMTAASLAIGASRWQTVWKVVLPSASPGIFAAIMIGFGRAVGETMIVLMATGNTPIMDWSIFNGMRTLSANIAVEIPEAPHNGTLYRVLFLSALMLFIVTFIANTSAEIVRTRLRERFGRF